MKLIFEVCQYVYLITIVKGWYSLITKKITEEKERICTNELFF